MRRTVSKFRGSNLALTLAAAPPRVGLSLGKESRMLKLIIYGDSSSSESLVLGR